MYKQGEQFFMTSKPDDETIEKLHYGTAIKLLGTCFFCGSDDVVGVGGYQPEDPNEFVLHGIPEGKTVRHIFRLCPDHVNLDQYDVKPLLKQKYDAQTLTPPTIYGPEDVRRALGQ